MELSHVITIGKNVAAAAERLRNIAIHLSFCLGFLLLNSAANAQGKSLDDSVARYSFHIPLAPISALLDSISLKTGENIVYQSNLPEYQKLSTLHADSMTLNQLLTLALRGSTLSFKRIGDDVVVKKRRINVVGKRYTISGKFKENDTGEEVIGATVWVQGTDWGSSSNAYGFYSLTIPEGNYMLEFRGIGYQKKYMPIELNADTSIDMHFDLESYQLQEVVITENTDVDNTVNFEELQMSRLKLSLATVKEVPALLGENDPIRAIQLLPGVSSGTEGSVGLFVRGGSADQNLILIDEAPVYNSSHLLGFFYIFNPDAMKEAQLYKGSIPAQYGGRLSSVLDIRLKEGNHKKPSLAGGIGTLSSRATLEYPFRQGKGTFIVSARRTYIDLLFKSFPDPSITANTFFFFDLNAKATYQLNKNNKLLVSAYTGQDKLGFRNYFSNSWGNLTGTVRWNHTFSPKLFMNTSFYGNQFRSTTESNLVEGFGYSTSYAIGDLGLKQNFTHYTNRFLQVDFGWEAVYHNYFFGKAKPIGSSIFKPQPSTGFNTLESAIYANVEHEVLTRLSLQYGLRYSRLDNMGPGKVYIYDKKDVVSPSTTSANIIDTAHYSAGQIINSYQGLSPRLSMRYMLTPKSSIKAAYNFTRQYVFQLYNSPVPSPADMWAPVTAYIPPQMAEQYSIGYYRTLRKKALSFSLEGFYKNMYNQIDFKPQADLLLNDRYETEVLLGKGVAYGLEFFVRKQEGKTTGWISYTLSRSERQINGINFNEPYPASYDRTHNISIVFSHKFHEQLTLSANWVFASGVAYTAPVGKYGHDGKILPYYTKRNDFRLPSTHRLDLSLTFYRKIYPGTKNESSFNFSIYNVYARKNTYAYIFRQKKDDPTQTETVKLYLFTIIPSFTYNFKF